MAQHKKACLGGMALFALMLAPLLQSAQVPRKAPDFAIPLNSGKTIALKDYRGKVVVLAFILTTCPHCRQTIERLNKQQGELGAEGLQVLAVAVDKGAKEAVPAFIQKLGLTFPVGFNSDSDTVLGFIQHPPDRLLHMPVVLFLDRQGVIQAQWEGTDQPMGEPQQEKNIGAKIGELLKAAAPSQKGRDSK